MSFGSLYPTPGAGSTYQPWVPALASGFRSNGTAFGAASNLASMVAFKLLGIGDMMFESNFKLVDDFGIDAPDAAMALPRVASATTRRERVGAFACAMRRYVIYFTEIDPHREIDPSEHFVGRYVSRSTLAVASTEGSSCARWSRD